MQGIQGVVRRLVPPFFRSKAVVPPLPPPLPQAHVLQRGNEAERQAYFDYSKQQNAESLTRRRSLVRKLPAGVLADMPRATGWSKCNPPAFAPLQAAVAEARECFAKYNPGASKREHDSLEGVPRLNRTTSSALVKLACDPHVLGVASRYLGHLPILYRINLLYSPNDASVDKSSQFYHLDPEDFEQVKLFVYVEDVDAEAGPFILMPADRSTVVRRTLNYRNKRVTDEQMFEIAGAKNEVVCTGPAGSMFFTDTSRCFHMGSRQGSRPRYALMIQYITPFAAMLAHDGPVGGTPLGPLARPAEMTEFDDYLFGVRR